MTVLPICITGNPVLHSPARPVEDFGDEFQTLIDDMFETVREAPGVGLAAPQVGVPLRVFIYDWIDDDGNEHRGVAANPTLLVSPTPVGIADDDDDSEGCLSIPGLRQPLLRSHRALLEAQDRTGATFRIDATGWLARIFQHEFDHLDGILYADRLGHLEANAVAKAIKKHRWGRPGLSWQPGVDNLEG